MNAQPNDFTQQMINNRKYGSVIEHIAEMIAIYNTPKELIGETISQEDYDANTQEMRDYPASIDFHASGWYSDPDQITADEYQILLAGGGPSLRIHGDLNEWDEPRDAAFQWQDWGTPWETQYTTDAEDEALLQFAQFHVFGG
jgi:hypothetical protein